MKVLITGARGYLAHYLTPIMLKNHEIWLTSLHSDKIISGLPIIPLNLGDFDKVNDLISSIKPDVIINTAAISLPDWAEEHKKETYLANVSAVKNLVKCCGAQSGNEIKLIQISTDYVFSGENPPYTEDSKPDPINYYGKTKLEAEEVILNAVQSGVLKDYLICRTTMLYGLKESHHRNNFFLSTYFALKNNLKVYASTQNVTCPTFIEDLAQCIKILIDHNSYGIFHTAGPESISRYEFAKIIAKIFEFDQFLIIPVQSHTKKALRPNNSTLNTFKLSKIINFKMCSVEEALLKLKNLININTKIKNLKI